MKTSLIKDFNQLNQDAIQAAKNSDWESVAKKMQVRRDLLENLFSHNIHESEYDVLRKMESTIIATDLEISEIIELEKKSTIATNINLKNAQNAVNAYRKTRNLSNNALTKNGSVLTSNDTPAQSISKK